jgi:hypothetical protein
MFGKASRNAGQNVPLDSYDSSNTQNTTFTHPEHFSISTYPSSLEYKPTIMRLLSTKRGHSK